jgi:peptidyl-prolyl cis-trans isomerase C
MGGAAILWGQRLPEPGTIIELESDNPNQIVAKLDGRPVTALEFQNLLVAMDPKARDAARNSAEEILRYVGWLRRMGAEAEKRGLADRNPLKMQLELNRSQLLSNAMLQHHELEEIVTPFEQRGYYQANLARYSAVNVKLIYLPFSTPTEELQAKKRAEELHARLKKGAAFTALVKEFSRHDESREKDGDYGEVKMTDQIPQIVKDTALALKDNEFSTPVRLANGYYLFMRTGLKVEPYESVKDQIFTEIKQQRNVEWVDKQRSAVKVEMKGSLDTKDPATVIAVLEGEPLTRARVDEYLAAMDEKLRRQVSADPAEMLRGIGHIRRLAKLAVESKLDERSPYKEQLELARLQALTNALMAENEKATVITEEELKKSYQENLTYVSSARLKIIFLPAGQDQAEDQAARQLATEIVEQIRGGREFVEMVKQYSKDPVSRDQNGDYGPLKITDDIPQPAKAAIWTTKVGEISNPVRMPNGYYVFKVMGFDAPGLDKVRDELTKRLRTIKSRDWLNSLRMQVRVEILSKSKPKQG